MYPNGRINLESRAMTKLFLSINFDHVELARQIKEELKRHGVEGVIAGELAEAPPPEIIRTLILTCDALLAIITSADYDWIQNEIGIAYAAKLPVYAIVNNDVNPGGLLPRITTYIRMSPVWGFDLKRKVAVIASELRATGSILVAIDCTQMLTGSTGRLQLSIRPRRIPSGEEIITIRVPPEFSIRLIQPDDLHERYPEIAAPIIRPTTTDIPRTACEISSEVAD